MASPARPASGSQRTFDDGAPLALWKRGPDAKPTGGVLAVCSVCDNPDCPCRAITLILCRLKMTRVHTARVVESDVARIDFDVDTGELTSTDAQGRPTTDAERQLIAEFRSLFTDKEARTLRDRWERVKSMQRDQWRRQDWSAIDIEFKVPFRQVFPADWDLSVDCDGRQFWLVDYWCLKPDCECTDVEVVVLDDCGGRVGSVRASLDGWKVLESSGDSLARRVWTEFIRQRNAKKAVRQRRRDMRRVAKEFPRFLPAKQPTPLQAASPPRAQKPPSVPSNVAMPRIGRNEPCPCGSGRKYKKCCGA